MSDLLTRFWLDVKLLHPFNLLAHEACTNCLKYETFQPMAFLGFPNRPPDDPKVLILPFVGSFTPAARAHFVNNIRTITADNNAHRVMLITEGYTARPQTLTGAEAPPQKKVLAGQEPQYKLPSQCEDKVEVLIFQVESYDPQGKIIAEMLTLRIERVNGKKAELFPHQHVVERNGNDNRITGRMAGLLIPREVPPTSA